LFSSVGTFFVTAQEEFHGEMKGWANVIRRFGAKADGVADDTKAIQMAIDSLSVKSTGFNTDSRAYAVVYLPKGNYRISATLRVSSSRSMTKKPSVS
jgi:polygalacturonase